MMPRTESSTSVADSQDGASRKSLQRATMRDVAKLAGVGIKTVSRVVNGEGHVAQVTAGRVRAAIAELGYEVDSNAVNLRQKRTDALGRRRTT